jgi:hypothetical protein
MPAGPIPEATRKALSLMSSNRDHHSLISIKGNGSTFSFEKSSPTDCLQVQPNNDCSGNHD